MKSAGGGQRGWEVSCGDGKPDGYGAAVRSWPVGSSSCDGSLTGQVTIRCVVQLSMHLHLRRKRMRYGWSVNDLTNNASRVLGI